MSRVQIVTIHDEQDPLLEQWEQYRRQRNELLLEKLANSETSQGGEDYQR